MISQLRGLGFFLFHFSDTISVSGLASFFVMRSRVG